MAIVPGLTRVAGTLPGGQKIVLAVGRIQGQDGYVVGFVGRVSLLRNGHLGLGGNGWLQPFFTDSQLRRVNLALSGRGVGVTFRAYAMKSDGDREVLNPCMHACMLKAGLQAFPPTRP
jgi:hypothetical protein